MVVPLWVEKYIGIPFVDLGRTIEGCDCWGLIRLILLNEAQIELPNWNTQYIKADDSSEVRDLFNQKSFSKKWMEIPIGTESTFDVAQMTLPYRTDNRWKFEPLHVGLIVIHGKLIHTDRATGSVVIPYSENYWQRRIHAIWHYVR